MIRKIARSTTLVLALALILASRFEVAIAASPESPQQGSSTAAKSEAAEAWDAIKDSTNPALFEAFIARYGTTFFAEIAKARLSELKAVVAKPPANGAKAIPTYPIHANPGQETPATGFRPSLQMPKDGVIERAVLYEENPADPKGQQFVGSVIWHTETIRSAGKPDELAARADVDFPSRGLRMRMSLKRNLDPSLPASHVADLTIATSADFWAGGVVNVPGILMKSNEQARGTPMAGLAVKVTEGTFLVGLSAVDADRNRNLQLLLERRWFDIPVVYANQRRAILAIDKGESGQQMFKTLLSAWGQYPDSTQPETDTSEQSKSTIPEEWKRTMMGRPKAQ